MYEILSKLTLAGFFLLAPIVVVTKSRQPKRLSWRAVVTIVGFGSWLLIVLSTNFYYWHLESLVLGNSEVDQSLLDRWANDGAKKTLTLFFGWLYGLVYLLPFLAIYSIVNKYKTATHVTK